MLAPGNPSMGKVLSALLWVDVLIELTIGAALVAWPGSVARWLDLGGSVRPIGIVFLVAAAVVAGIAVSGRHPFVRLLGWTNLAGGLGGWAVLIGRWGSVEPEGRWIASAVLDTFIALGLLELFALRRVPARDA